MDKKSGDLFDVAMGSFDGAELCELVGIYLLHKLSNIMPIQDTGLYRDDGLIAVPNANGRKMDVIRKKLHKCFREEGLKILVQINLIESNFLDVTLNLADGTYKPYRKPNDTPLYVHIESNHPPLIKKNLPAMINKRIMDISSNQKVFNESKEYYQEALRKSGHKKSLKWEKENNSATHESKKKKSRSRKIMWYNPPFNSNVKTNIGKEFFSILDKQATQNLK